MDWRHSRPFRIILLLGFVLFLLAALVPRFVHIDFIRDSLTRAVFESTGRTLTLKQAPRFVLLPFPALLINEVQLSEPGRSQLFAEATSARIGLSFLPLLRGQIEVNSLEVEAPQLIILRHENGGYNFEDLLGQKEMRQIRFGLERLIFKDAIFRFSDGFLGKSLKLTELNVGLTELTDPKAGSLSLQGTLLTGEDNEAAWWKGKITAHAAVRYHEEDRRIRLADLEIKLLQQGESGSALQLKETTLMIEGGLIYDWSPFRLSGGDLRIKATAQRASQQWRAELILPEIKVSQFHLDLNDLQFSSQMESPQGTLSARVAVAQLGGATGKRLKTANASISLRLRSPEQSLTLDLVSPAELEHGTLARLTGYHLAGSYGNKSLPRGAIPFNLHGTGFLDLRNEAAQLDSHGVLDRSPFKLRIALNNFVAHRYRVDLNVTRLDLTPYLPDTKKNTMLINEETPFDFWWLERLHAEGSVYIGELLLPKTKVHHLSFDLNAANKKLVLHPLKATLYGGQLTGRAEVDTSLKNKTHSPSFKIQQQLDHVDMHALTYDLTESNRFEGKGSFNLDLGAAGMNLSHLRHTVNGSAFVRLYNGVFRGVDIEGLLRAAHMQANMKTQPSIAGLKVPISDRTRFREMKAKLVIRQGIANNHDLQVISPIFSIKGMGRINLKENSIDYLLEASGLRKPGQINMTDLPLPIHISGSLTAPEYKTDYTTFKEHILATQKKTARLVGRKR